MILPPPMPPAEPEGPNEGAAPEGAGVDGVEMEAFRKQAGFPEGDGERNTRMRGVMVEALGRQFSHAQGAVAAAGVRKAEKAPVARNSQNRLQWLCVAAMVAIILGWIVIPDWPYGAQRPAQRVADHTSNVRSDLIRKRAGTNDFALNQHTDRTVGKPPVFALFLNRGAVLPQGTHDDHGTPQSGYGGAYSLNAVDNNYEVRDYAGPDITLDANGQLPPAPAAGSANSAYFWSGVNSTAFVLGSGGGGGGGFAGEEEQALVEKDLGIHYTGIAPQEGVDKDLANYGTREILVFALHDSKTVTESGRPTPSRTVSAPQDDKFAIQERQIAAEIEATRSHTLTRALNEETARLAPSQLEGTSTGRSDINQVLGNSSSAPGRSETVQLESMLGILNQVPARRLNPTVVEPPTPPGSTDTKAALKLPPAAAWKPSPCTPNAARLMIGDQDELPLKAVQANIHVDGFRARVLIDLYFYNDRDQQFQGNFNLRLPDGASPYYFAFGETVFKAADGTELPDPMQPQLFNSEQAMHISLRPERIQADRQGSWTQPKVARMVPREQAAFAYRDTVYRRRIDPALLEWSGAGVFAARVFPLLPKKLHRVVIGYDVDLTRQDRELRYPFELPKNVPQVAVDLSIAPLQGILPASDPDNQFTLQVTPAGNALQRDGRACYRFDNTQAEAIAVTWRQGPAHREQGQAGLADGSQPAGRKAILLTGTEPKEEGGGAYFAAQLVAPLPAPECGPGAPEAIFLVDTSLSTNPAKFNVYRRLVASILDHNRAATDAAPGSSAAAGITRFKVLFFNIATRWWRTEWTANTVENAAAALAEIDWTVLEGASDINQALTVAGFNDDLLYALDQRELNNGRAAYFLLSDGAATWGETNLLLTDPAKGLVGKLRPRAHHSLFAYLAGTIGNNRNGVQALADLSGGAVFSVADEEAAAKPETAMSYRYAPWRLLGMAVEDPSGTVGPIDPTDTAGSTVTTDCLVAGNPSTLYPGQVLTMAGRGKLAPGAEIVLLVQSQADRAQRLTVPIAARVVSDLAARAYGQVAVERIERHRAEMRREAGGLAAGEIDPAESLAQAYACHFRVTGQSCSLLMLESEEEYQRYNISNELHSAEIERSPVAALVARAGGAASAWTRNPPTAKSAFLAQAARLSRLPGCSFAIPPAVVTVWQSMPESSFFVRQEALLPMMHRPTKLPDVFRVGLAAGTLDRAGFLTELERRQAAGDRAGALVAFSSTVELAPGDGAVLREVAYRAMALGCPGHAYYLLKRVALARPFESDLYLLMAQCLDQAGQGDLALAYYELVLAGPGEPQIGGRLEIVTALYRECLNRMHEGALKTSVPEYAAARREQLARTASAAGAQAVADLAVLIDWNTDGTDVDLHVTEPSGEECFYSHAVTKAGGLLSRDITTGYGPELYRIPQAAAGSYKLQVKYFAGDRTRASAATTVAVTVIRGLGSAQPRVSRRVVTLAVDKEMHDLGVEVFK